LGAFANNVSIKTSFVIEPMATIIAIEKAVEMD